MTKQSSITRRGFLGESLAAGIAAVPLARTRTRAAQAEAAAAYRVGMYTRPWDQHDYRVALDAIAETGFEYAGLMTTKRELGGTVISASTTPEQAARVAQEVRERGLQVTSVYGGGIPVAKSLEAGIAGMKQLIDNCAAVGARSLLMGGIANEKLFDVYYKAIAETCDYAAEKKLAITIKPHGGLNATGAQCRKCIETVGHKNFSLWYDPGNIFFYSQGEIDPVDDAATVDGLVREGMCVKDYAPTSQEGKLVGDVWITPGQGKVNFPKLLSRLRQGGFRGGDLVIECVARGDGQLRTILAEARKARHYVEQLVAGLV